MGCAAYVGEREATGTNGGGIRLVEVPYRIALFLETIQPNTVWRF